MVRAERLRRFFRWVLRGELLRPRQVVAILLVPGLAGCLSGLAGRGRLDDAVVELNQAARFGRADVAFERVAPTSRRRYADHHSTWGTEVRIVDVDYTGTETMTSREAVVLVAYHWFRPGENALHTTSVRQTWRSDPKAGSWTLTDEQLASGDPGLLGDAATPHPSSKADDHATAPQLDAAAPRHFPTTIIR